MFPFEISDVKKEQNDEIIEYFKGQVDGCVQVGPDKYCLPKLYEKHAEGYYNFEILDDDVWIVTFPRSGTTWTQELIWLILNDLDFEKSKTMEFFEKVPFFEIPVLHAEGYLKQLRNVNGNDENASGFIEAMSVQGYDRLKDTKSPRFIKSHLPLSLLPPNLLKKAKVIYVARNPKDVVVSYYHHNSAVGIHGFQGDFEKYWTFFREGLVEFGPQVPHVKEAWDVKDDPNMLFLFYEDLSRDFPGSINKVAKFLGKNLSEQDVNLLNERLHFDRMRASDSEKKPPFNFKDPVNTRKVGFFRRGKVGGNEEYTERLGNEVDKWIKDQEEKYRLKFP